MDGATYAVSSADVLRLADEADHPPYDCEYVALAQELSVTLVTGDRAVANLFPDTAVLLEDFASGEEWPQETSGSLAVAWTVRYKRLYVEPNICFTFRPRIRIL